MPSSIVLGAVFGDTLLAGAALGSFGMAAASFAINYAVSTLVSRAFGSRQSMDNPSAPDSGVRQQIPPSNSNSLPVVYGDAYLGGVFVDAVLSTDQKTMYYVLAVSHISPVGQFSFDQTKMYWGDRLITFDGTDLTKVVSLTDGSGNVDTKCSGNIYMGLYTSSATGVITSTNGATAPSTFMGGADVPVALRWPTTGRQMQGLAFAIVKLNYNQDAGVTGMQGLTFKASHYLNGTGAAKPGDVWYDYITNVQYGGAVSTSIADSASATALNSYSDATITYTPSGGGSATQPRYRINGVIDTAKSCVENLDNIMTACDSWTQYSAAKGQFSVVINQAQSAAFDFNDDTIMGEIRVSAIDIANQVNQLEAQFPSKLNKDQTDFVFLQTPSGLLYPNEPVNKSTIKMELVNDSVQAQYLANRMLEQAREDLIVTFALSYPGIQVDAGDVITVTNSSYGWAAKPFRVMKVNEVTTPDGSIAASLELNEYNAAVYDDASITAYAPAPNSYFASPDFFGTINPPTVAASYPTAAVPSFVVQPYTGASSIITYAEIWYSAFSSPTASQRFLAGVTALQASGVPYVPGSTLPTVTVTDLPQGDWYLFTRLVNSLATSQFSSASSLFSWKPMTFQFTERYLVVAYATNSTGTAGFGTDPRSKTYFGLLNSAAATWSTNPADYKWYPGTFSTANYLLFANRASRRFSFGVGNAAYANLTGTFVPTETSIYDVTLWSGLPDGDNYIDLDARTGQLTSVGTTSVSSADGLVSVRNNTDGSMVVALEKFLNFGAGVYTKTAAVSTLTIDVYGRVVGFTQPDDFYYTESVFTATGGQTSFSVTHTVGNVLVFRNGLLLDTADYSETGTTVVLANACAAGETVVVINMRAVSTSAFYATMGVTIASSASSSIVYTGLLNQAVEAGDLLAFTDGGTTYTVSTVNTSTKTITFTGSISGATAGNTVYRYRAASSTYRPFTRFTVDLTNASDYTSTDYTITSGTELIFVNGSAFNEIDYDLSGDTINGFPANVTGKMTVFLFSNNNLGVPASNITNTVAYSASGIVSYTFPSNPLSMEIYANGALLTKGSGLDYTATSSGYNLTTAFSNNFTLLNQQTYARTGAA